jgi:hypothetical protein
MVKLSSIICIKVSLFIGSKDLFTAIFCAVTEEGMYYLNNKCCGFFSACRDLAALERYAMSFVIVTEVSYNSPYIFGPLSSDS